MKINRSIIITAIVTLVIGLLLGWLIFGGAPEMPAHDEHVHTSEAGQATTIWTCSMHPQIRQSEPGKCPICGMELIPLESGEGELDPMAVSMSPTAMQLASIETAVVGKGKSVKSVRLNGKVEADERLIFSQSTHIPGRIEKLLVNFTGEMVKKGQVIASVYSPELVTAQEELFEANKIKETQPQLFNSAKEKLKNWKLTDQQINQILESGKTKETFPILSDVTGYVVNKKVNLGDYIMKGMPIYEVADLSKVWLLFDVYESDMTWVKKGDMVSFTIASLPGENFKGKVSYIDPVIDPKTRVAKARVEVSNSGYKLKPEMFASGLVDAGISGNAEQIIIPKTAVMWTGERSVVYIKNTTAQGVSFQMREIILGADLGDSFMVVSGLEPGEEIAVNGTFSIDAAAQLAGKPSMMNPQGGPAMTGHNHGGMAMPDEEKTGTHQNHQSVSNEITISNKAKASLQPIFSSYLKMKDALTNDSLEEAIQSSVSMKESMAKVSMSLFTGDSHNILMKYSSELEKSLQHMPHQSTLEDFRMAFLQVSDLVIAMAKSFKPMDSPLYVDFCPMANNNKGAFWLSASEDIRNPYFGEAMIGCGEVKSTIK